MPSRAYTSFLLSIMLLKDFTIRQVSMPSRAYTSFLQRNIMNENLQVVLCQCPLGLIPHFYLATMIAVSGPIASVSMPSRAYTSFLRSKIYAVLKQLLSVCQCPLGLIPHFYCQSNWGYTLALAKCQCPLGLIPHFYGTPSKT